MSRQQVVKYSEKIVHPLGGPLTHDHLLTYSLTRSFFCSLAHTLTHSLTYWLTHQLTHSGTHSLLLSTAHWLTKRARSLAPSLPCSLAHSLARRRTHSFILFAAMGRTSSYTTKIFIHQSLSPPALPHIRTRPAQIFLPIFDSSPSRILRYAARSLALGGSFSVYLKAESISHVGISCTDVDQLDFFVAGIISFRCHCTLHL